MPLPFRITVLLLLLPLNMAVTAMPGFVFQAQGAVFQIGSCFGADNMIAFKSYGTGDQLLVNYSASGGFSYFPEDLQVRANITDYDSMLGLLMGQLNPRDEGIYRTECWQNETLVSNLRKQLVVCREKVEFGEMSALEDDWAEVRCNSGVGAQAGTTIQWYYDPYSNYSLRAGAVPLDPPFARRQGAVEVRERGALLHVSNSVLQDSFSFYCVVMKGQNCLSFQTIYQPGYVHVRTIYASHGDRVALACSSENKSQSWETPLGKIKTSTKSPGSSEGSTHGGHMYISRDIESKSFLIIPAASDEHMGQYSCFSPTLQSVYHIAFCPRMESREISVVERGDILLECDVHQKAPGDGTSVEWHRDRASGEASLIQNTTDEAAARTGNPRRGMVLSEDGFSLKISGLTAEDAGVYWCIVTEDKEEEEEEDDSDHSAYGGLDDGYNDYNDYGNGRLRVCISKQQIVLTVTLTPIKVKGDASLAPDPGVPGYALGAGLAAGLLLVGVMAAVAVMKARSKGCFRQGGAATDTGPNFHQDTEMVRDPGCTEMLAPNEPSNAC